MVFSKKFKRKASGICPKRKGGSSYAAWKAANSDADAAPLQDTTAAIADPPQDVNAVDIPAEGDSNPHPQASKKRRKDENWRSNRAVVALTKKLSKEKDKKVQLIKANNHLKRSAVRADMKANEAGHNAYVTAKVYREMHLKTEEEHKHKLERINKMHIAQLEDACKHLSTIRDKYESELAEAYAVSDAQMAKAIAAEEAIFHRESRNKQILRKERHLHEAKLSKAQGKFNKERLRLEAKLFGANEKLAKERRGHELVMCHREHQWRKALKFKLARAATIHRDETKDMHRQMEKMNDNMTAERVDNANRYVYHL